MIRASFVLGIALLATACVEQGSTPPPWDPSASIAASPPAPPPPRASDSALLTAAARVKVLQTGGLGCEMQSLGIVDVHEPMKTEQAALDLLKRRAAALGAEGVMGVEFHHGEGGGETTHLSGIAVKCSDLLRGRSYDVLEKIDIAGGMGEEDEAYDKMKQRAAQIHADLIIDISFEHGEGVGAKTHVYGTAIKLRSTSRE
jgi:uncharacterized protein YbjQ (UPF0145 family)